MGDQFITQYLSFLRTLYLYIIFENHILLRHPVKHSLVQNMLKIFMAVCLLPSANDDELNILFHNQLREYAILPLLLSLSVTKIRITSPRTVFLKYGQVGFSKAGITSSFHENLIYLIFSRILEFLVFGDISDLEHCFFSGKNFGVISYF